MKTPIAKAFFQDMLDAAWIYRLGAAVRLGLPDRPPRNVISDDKSPSVLSDVSSPKGGYLKPALVAALLGTGLGAAGMALLPDDDRQQAQGNTTINTTGDLIEWLDDKGYAP